MGGDPVPGPFAEAVEDFMAWRKAHRETHAVGTSPISNLPKSVNARARAPEYHHPYPRARG